MHPQKSWKKKPAKTIKLIQLTFLSFLHKLICMNFFLNKFKRFSKIHYTTKTTFIQQQQHLYNQNNIYTTTTTFIQQQQHLYNKSFKKHFLRTICYQ